jgi:tetratricopeptide (TPR) repeat protein
MVLNELKQFDEALASFDRALALRPNDADALNSRGNTLHELERFDEALASFDSALLVKPGDAEVLYNRGVTLRRLERHDEALASYDQTLSVRPNLAEATNNRGKLLSVPHILAQALEQQRQGHFAEAEQLYTAILAVRPNQFDALHMLGVIKFAQGQLSEALQLLADAMRSKSPSPLILLNYGLVLNALNRHSEALESFDHAITLEPRVSEAHIKRGAVLAVLGRDEEALESFRKALAITPKNPQVHYNLGNSFRKLGHNEEALKSYDRALALQPNHTEALCNRGITLRELKQFDKALASYDRALALRPDYAEAIFNRGNTLHELKRFDEALASFDDALSVRPNLVEAINNRANTLHELKRFEEALASLDRVLSVRPDDAEALNNRGNALGALKRVDDAIASYDRALALRPDYAEAHYNRGNALSAIGRHNEALASICRATAIKPTYADAQLNEALLRLRLGDLFSGWEKYEWRWKRDDGSMEPRNFAQPLWLGQQPVAGKTILLHAEQGFGDTIQFVRYAKMLVQQNARVIIEVQQPLKSLISQLGSDIRIVTSGEEIPSFDLHCPLLSLPLAFRTDLSTIPADIPYLAVPGDYIEKWNDRLSPRRWPRVGIVWSGNSRNFNDWNRSIALGHMMPIFETPNIEFVSLQKELRDSDAQILAADPRITDLGSHFDDFSDTAAVIAQLDLVIAVDTSVAHLAGALGKPVWVLLPFCPDWRWLLGRDDSPWYPTARLFRQNDTRTWDSVILRVQEALRELVEANGNRHSPTAPIA